MLLVYLSWHVEIPAPLSAEVQSWCYKSFRCSHFHRQRRWRGAWACTPSEAFLSDNHGGWSQRPFSEAKETMSFLVKEESLGTQKTKKKNNYCKITASFQWNTTTTSNNNKNKNKTNLRAWISLPFSSSLGLPFHFMTCSSFHELRPKGSIGLEYVGCVWSRWTFTMIEKSRRIHVHMVYAPAFRLNCLMVST